MSDATRVADLKDGLRALIVAALPRGVDLYVSLSPAEVEALGVSEFVVLELGDADGEPSPLFGEGAGVSQYEQWRWVLYIGVGPSRQREDRIDRLSAIFSPLWTALRGQRPTADADPLQLVSTPRFYADRGEVGERGAVYVTEWQHGYLT